MGWLDPPSTHSCREPTATPLLGFSLSPSSSPIHWPPCHADRPGTFQRLLHTLHAIGESHGSASVAAVALAYTLQLESVVAAIVGVRLGVGDAAHHHHDSLAALSLRLSEAELRAIDEVVDTGVVLDGLART